MKRKAKKKAKARKKKVEVDPISLSEIPGKIEGLLNGLQARLKELEKENKEYERERRKMAAKFNLRPSGGRRTEERREIEETTELMMLLRFVQKCADHLEHDWECEEEDDIC